MPNISIEVNSKPVSLDIEARMLLVELLREELGLTGTHVGCDTSQCGACVVHVDGAPVKSCTMLALQADGMEVITIEGIGEKDKLNPLQQAFYQHHGLQCGFCTPGMIMTASALLRDNPEPTEEEVRHELEGNLCRCTGYQNIIKAILDAANIMRG